MLVNSLTRNLYNSQKLSVVRYFSLLSKNTLKHKQSAVLLMQYPMRFVHPRGYNDFYDNWSFRFNEINFALGGSKNTDNMVFVFKKYGQWMTDVQIAYAFWYIAKNQLEKTPEFWSIIVPAVKTQLKTLDRNCTKSLLHFIEGAGAMQL